MSEWTIQAINHVKQLLVLGLTVTDCVSISTLSSFVCVPVGITSSELGIKTCAVTAGIKLYRSIIKKNKTSKIK